MELFQPCEITQRRQICIRINELKSSCAELTGFRDHLQSRLSELNKIVDHLIAEKRAEKYDPNLKINLASYQLSNDQHSHLNRPHEKQAYTSNLTSDDLIPAVRYSQKSSDSFRLKLSYCLQEITSKADEIDELSEQLYPSSE